MNQVLSNIKALFRNRRVLYGVVGFLLLLVLLLGVLINRNIIDVRGASKLQGTESTTEQQLGETSTETTATSETANNETNRPSETPASTSQATSNTKKDPSGGEDYNEPDCVAIDEVAYAAFEKRRLSINAAFNAKKSESDDWYANEAIEIYHDGLWIDGRYGGSDPLEDKLLADEALTAELEADAAANKAQYAKDLGKYCADLLNVN
jgi:hypothetical protein